MTTMPTATELVEAIPLNCWDAIAAVRAFGEGAYVVTLSKAKAFARRCVDARDAQWSAVVADLRAKLAEAEARARVSRATHDDIARMVASSVSSRQTADYIAAAMGVRWPNDKETTMSEVKMDEQALEERDAAYRMLDNFVDAVGGIAVCGEHSNLNDPWDRALDEVNAWRQSIQDAIAELAAVEKRAEQAGVVGQPTGVAGNAIAAMKILRSAIGQPENGQLRPACKCDRNHVDDDEHKPTCGEPLSPTPPRPDLPPMPVAESVGGDELRRRTPAPAANEQISSTTKAIRQAHSDKITCDLLHGPDPASVIPKTPADVRLWWQRVCKNGTPPEEKLNILCRLWERLCERQSDSSLKFQANTEAALQEVAEVRYQKVQDYSESRYEEQDPRFNQIMLFSDVHRKYIRLRHQSLGLPPSQAATRAALRETYMDLCAYAAMGMVMIDLEEERTKTNETAD